MGVASVRVDPVSSQNDANLGHPASLNLPITWGKTAVMYIQLTAIHPTCIIVYIQMKICSLTGMMRRTEQT
jgi:hypothetical protein